MIHIFTRNTITLHAWPDSIDEITKTFDKFFINIIYIRS